MAITLVQTAGANSSGNVTSRTLTFSSAPTAGNLLVACIAYGNNGTLTLPTGWVTADSVVNGTTLTVVLAYAANCASTNGLVFTIGTSGSLEVSGAEYSGLATSSPLDVTAHNSGSSTTEDSGTTGTTTQANELFVAALGYVNASALTLGSPTNSFTSEKVNDSTGGTNIVHISLNDKIVSSTGTANTSRSLSSSSTWGGVVATFATTSVGGATQFSGTVGGQGNLSGNMTGTFALAGTVGGQGNLSGLLTATFLLQATVGGQGNLLTAYLGSTIGLGPFTPPVGGQGSLKGSLTSIPPRFNVKEQIVHVYNAQGQFLDIWRDCPLLGSAGCQGPKFALNTVTSQITVTLPRAFDAFDEAGDSTGRGTVGAGNIVQFWIVDQQNYAAGRLVFQGYIDGYSPRIDQSSGQESIDVLITPFDAILGDMEFVGTQNFGTAGSSSTYVDPVLMWAWVFGYTIYCTSATAVTGGTTTTITLANGSLLKWIAPGQQLYLQGTGADSAKTNGPLIVQSVNSGTNQVTFTAAIPTNSYSNTIIVGVVAPLTSATAVTGGTTTAIVVNAATGLNVNATIGLVGTGADLGKSETAVILSIVGTTVTFTKPLTNSYSATIGVCPAVSQNNVTGHEFTNPLTWDSGNVFSSGVAYQLQFHNQTIVSFFENVRTLAPANWFWRMNHATKTITFALAPATATHNFVVGKQISQPDYAKNFSNLKNYVYVKGTSVTATSTGSDISTYNQRSIAIVEPRITDQTTCNRFAAGTLAQLDRIDYRSTITVVDNRGDPTQLGYDIETMQIGDTVQIRNSVGNLSTAKWDSAVWDTDFWDYPAGATVNQISTILALTYKFDTVDIEISNLQPSQDRFLIQLANQLNSYQTN